MARPPKGATVQGLNDAQNEEQLDYAEEIQVEPKLRNNAKLDLSRFDYTKLEGKTYDEYIDYLFGEVLNPDDRPSRRVRGNGMMRDNDKYVFEVYKAKPIRKPVYPELENSPWKVTGLRLDSEKPVNEVNTQWKYVKETFGQLEVNAAHSMSTLIYLPKKVN